MDGPANDPDRLSLRRVSPLIRRDDVVPGVGEHRQLVVPAVCQFRKSVQQQHDGPSRCTGLEHMRTQACGGVELERMSSTTGALA